MIPKMYSFSDTAAIYTRLRVLLRNSVSLPTIAWAEGCVINK